MKQTLPNLMVVCALIFAVVLTGCKKNETQTPQSTSDKLVGKWLNTNTINKTTSQGVTTTDTTTFTNGQYYEFTASGTVTMGSSLTIGSANWKIVNDKLQIYTTDKLSPGDGYDITVLTTTALQLHFVQTNNGVTVEVFMNFVKAAKA